MTVFVCEDSLEGVLSGIYDAWASHIHRDQLKLFVGPVTQYEFFMEYIDVPPDSEKTDMVMRTIRQKISMEAYLQCMRCAQTYYKDRADVIYRFLLLGFSFGAKITSCLGDPRVMKLFEYSRIYGNEAHLSREFLRFSRWEPGIYLANISPKCDVISQIGTYFADRMPSEHFMIIDEGRQKALIHPADSPWFIRRLTDKELQILKNNRLLKDETAKLWKTFFESISIKERENPVCQRSHLPLHFRGHMTEFQSDI